MTSTKSLEHIISYKKLPKTVKKLIIVIEKELDKQAKAYGNCQKCYGKGYSTQWRGLHGYPDFINDKGFDKLPKTEINFCSCQRGKDLKKLFNTFKK